MYEEGRKLMIGELTASSRMLLIAKSSSLSYPMLRDVLMGRSGEG
jgi:hypothetical protein